MNAEPREGPARRNDGGPHARTAESSSRTASKSSSASSRAAEIDRRRFLALAGALGVGAAAGFAPRRAAQAKEVVLVNWGGIANVAFGNFYGKPFEARNPGVQGGRWIRRVRRSARSRRWSTRRR
jgi:hypothetical protein